MGRLSREKGKAAERRVARAYRQAVGAGQRGLQARGPESADVGALCFWNEVKDRKAVACRAAWEQARDEAPADMTPVAVTHLPQREWLVTLGLEDWLAVLQGMRETAEAVQAARQFVYRARFARGHEQDRADAEAWWQKWGGEQSA
jgi:hypothetical protein